MALLVLLLAGLVLLVIGLEHPQLSSLPVLAALLVLLADRASPLGSSSTARGFLLVLQRVERDEEGREVPTYLDSSAAPPRACRALEVYRAQPLGASLLAGAAGRQGFALWIRTCSF